MMARCHCRPGCLSQVRPSDVTVETVDGAALPSHLALAVPSSPAVPYPVPSPLSVLAKVGAA